MLFLERGGSGIPFLFLHAFPLSRRMWEVNRPAFARHFHYLSVDLPGFGDSPSIGATATMEAMADQVLQTLDANAVTEPVIVAGLSMGGYVLLPLLKRAPERFRAAVFVSTRAIPDSPEGKAKRFANVERIEREGLDGFADTMSKSLLGKTTQADAPAIVSSVKSQIQSADPAGVCAALRGMAERPDRSDVLPTLPFPCLFVSGEEDTVVPSTDMEAMASHAKRGELQRVAKAGHLLNLEQPAVFNEIVHAFLKRRVL